MGKKGKGKGGKKKKEPEDFAKKQVEKYVTVEIRNSIWQTMRFTQRVKTTSTIQTLINLIMARHNIAGTYGLTLYIGEKMDESSLLQPQEYDKMLAEVNVYGGSINDNVLQVVTYEYMPHKTEDDSSAGIAPARNYGMSNLPRTVVQPPLRLYGSFG